MDNSPHVSIVVIGKNESQNLDSTFEAINSADYPAEKLEIIYVDTGSTDRSVEIARKYADKVFIELSQWPTSGLARNRGIIESSHEIIHFIDGDIDIHKDYLIKAISKLKEKGVNAVTGYFEEKDLKSFFNRIMNIRREEIIHEDRFCESTNGGGTYEKIALLQLNGYDERILKGQESELGYRFRKEGFKIYFINQVQGIHDFGISSIQDFIKSKFVYGKSFGYILKLKDDLNEYIIKSKKSARKIILNNLISICVIGTVVVTGIYLMIGVYYILRLLYIILINKFLRKRSNRNILYSLIQYIFLFTVFVGIIAVFLNPKYKAHRKQLLKGD